MYLLLTLLKSFLFFQCVLLVCGTTENVLKLTNKRLSQISNNTFAILVVEDLAEISLAKCGIRDVHKNTFKGMFSLEKLRLPDNRISRLDIDTFEDNRQLEAIDLANNQLKSIENGLFDKLHHLKILDLTVNNIETIGDTVFHNLIKLEILGLNINRITSLHDLQFKNNFKLFNLQLMNNLISDLNFLHKNVKSLKTLNLEANKISQLKPDLLFDYPYLEHISFGNNIINNISVDFFSKNFKLKKIDLNENLLIEIKNGLFSHLTRLESLTLFGNKISRIEEHENIFPNTTTFRQLNLNANELVYLNASIIKPLHGLRREGIGLALNPWICDCDLQELYKEWKIIGNPYLAEPTCNEPGALKGTKWVDLKVEDFHCDENEVSVLGNKKNDTIEEFAELLETLV